MGKIPVDYERTKRLVKCLEWAKNQGYTRAEEALRDYGSILGISLFFKCNVWSGGEYYTVESVDTLAHQEEIKV